jgi:hypothetical protein
MLQGVFPPAPVPEEGEEPLGRLPLGTGPGGPTGPPHPCPTAPPPRTPRFLAGLAITTSSSSAARAEEPKCVPFGEGERLLGDDLPEDDSPGATVDGRAIGRAIGPGTMAGLPTGPKDPPTSSKEARRLGPAPEPRGSCCCCLGGPIGEGRSVCEELGCCPGCCICC